MWSIRFIGALLAMLVAGATGAMPVTYTSGLVGAHWTNEGYVFTGSSTQTDISFSYFPDSTAGLAVQDELGRTAASDRSGSIQESASSTDTSLLYNAIITTEAYARVDAGLTGTAFAEADLFIFAPVFEVQEAVQYSGSELLYHYDNPTQAIQFGDILLPGSYLPSFYHADYQATAIAQGGETVYVKNIGLMQFAFTSVAVPAPPALWLLGGGLLALLLQRQKRHQECRPH